jgi:hypothetical protein
MKILAGILLGFFSVVPLAWGQANVNEGLEKAHIWVDGVNGSNSNPGTQKRPLRTIGMAMTKAITNNQKSIGTLVTINPATYRESISAVKTRKDTSLPMTFEAATNGTVIVSGADVWTGWSPYSGNSNIYTNSWPYQWGMCPPDSGTVELPIVRRREMIFVNGTPATQVLSLSEMQPGTFSVDETNQIVYLWPAAGTDMGTATVEVAKRGDLLHIYGRDEMVFRGLIFQYSDSCRYSAAVTVDAGANNILFDTDQFLWNNAQGLSVQASSNQLTVQNSVANHNGEAGYWANKVKEVLWQTDQASYNNWRGAQGIPYDFDSGGYRTFHVHDSSFAGATAFFNQAAGIHWDTDHADITGDSMVFAYNLLHGLEIERDEGPVTVSNGSICYNGAAPTWYTIGGLNLRDSEYVTLTGTALVDNQQGQILLVGQVGGSSVTNWETGQQYTLYNEDETLSQNTIVASTQGQDVFYDDSQAGTWKKFQSTLASDYNDWWNPINDEDFIVLVPKPGTAVDLPGWQSDTGQDADSTWAQPSGTPGAACQVTPDIPDYWLIAQTGYNQTVTASNGQAVVTLTTVALDLSGTVNLSIDGVQNIKGASASFDPSSISTSGTSILTISAGSNTSPGTYPVTVSGNSGNVTRTVAFDVVFPKQWR